MKYTITIPEPCHEKWHLMTPTEKGRFCTSCAKEVIDFTNSSTYSLAKKLDRGEKLCGRFRKDQLNRPITSKYNGGLQRTGLAFGITSLLALCTPASAQTQVQEQKVHEVITLGMSSISKQERTLNQPRIKISGVVLDSDNMPLPGANIVLEGTSNGTRTDFEGNFELEIPAAYQETNPRIEISYIGFETKYVCLDSFKGKNAVKLKLTEAMLGGIVIVRNNIFTKVANLFKKKKKVEEKEDTVCLNEPAELDIEKVGEIEISTVEESLKNHTSTEHLEIEEMKSAGVIEGETKVPILRAKETKIWPNPVADEFNVSHLLNEEGHLKISLKSLDQPFQTPIILFDEFSLPGHFQKRLSLPKQVVNGVYVLRLESPGNIETFKLLVDRK